MSFSEACTSKHKYRTPAKTAGILITFLVLSGAANAATALVADRLIEGNSSTPKFDVVVLIEDNHIVVVGNLSIIPPGTEVIELGDAILLPGLINAHDHPLAYADDYQPAMRIRTGSEARPPEG